jgi:hypothetical protein
MADRAAAEELSKSLKFVENISLTLSQYYNV